MTHPFDEIAVEAAAKAIRSDCFDPENIKFFEDLWCKTEREKAFAGANAALSAAFQSARERGMAIEAFGSAPEDGGYSAATWATALEPVTIIRHTGE